MEHSKSIDFLLYIKIGHLRVIFIKIYLCTNCTSSISHNPLEIMFFKTKKSNAIKTDSSIFLLIQLF